MVQGMLCGVPPPVICRCLPRPVYVRGESAAEPKLDGWRAASRDVQHPPLGQRNIGVLHRVERAAMITSSARTLACPNLGKRPEPNITKCCRPSSTRLERTAKARSETHTAATPRSWRHPQPELRRALFRRRPDLSP